jgi:hypothetical protein
MIEQQEIQKLQGSWKKQGKAKEADVFLVAREKFLVASGMEAERAKDLAWKNTVEAFPYVEPPKPKKKAAPKKRAAAKKVAPVKVEKNEEEDDTDNEGLEEEIEKFLGDSGSVMLEDDVEWVYLHLSARNLSPSDAPSPGAWSLHSVARKDKRWFLKDIVPKIRHKKEDDDQKSMRVAEVKSIKQRQTILEGVVSRSKASVLEVLQTRLAVDSTPKSR